MMQPQGSRTMLSNEQYAPVPTRSLSRRHALPWSIHFLGGIPS